MAEAMGLSAFTSGSSNGGDIIYNALVNGIGMVITLIPYGGSGYVSYTGYNALYYMANGTGDVINTVTGWIYSLDHFTNLEVYIGYGSLTFEATDIKLTSSANNMSVTCFLFNA